MLKTAGILLLLFLPEEILPLLVVIMACLSIVGVIRPGQVFSALIFVAFLPVISLLVEEILALFPWYVGITLLVLLATNVARLVLELFLGKEAAGHVLGSLVLSIARGLFLLLMLPVRALFLVLRGGAGAPVRRFLGL